MKADAFLLAHSDTPEIRNAGKILRFFGVDCLSLDIESFLAYCAQQNDHAGESSSNTRILCSSDTFAELLDQMEKSVGVGELWEKHVHSVFVYATPGVERLSKVARAITGDEAASIREIIPGTREFVVASSLGGVMAGVRGKAKIAPKTAVYFLRSSTPPTDEIISLRDGPIFLRLTYRGVPLFFSTSTSIADIDSPLDSGIFDIRDHLPAALSLVLYIKWAFADTSWSSPETGACLVIDDPLLRERHGFVNFIELSSLMKQHNFSTSIAFIPWNWRRNSVETIELFKGNSERYSISVHGCDHNEAEFGEKNPAALDERVSEALKRMDQHEAHCGIKYDKVMVFPQGVFSKAAVGALKRGGFIAAVNNDTIATDSEPGSVTIADFWQIAVMNYDNFPIFTRRYPWEGIENFAFDILLGKPALAVIHHDYCRDGCCELVCFIERLNALNCRLKWRSLGDVVRWSYRQRELSADLVELEMCGTEARVHNSSARRRRYRVRKRESQPSDIVTIVADAEQLTWNTVDGFVRFETQLDPGETSLLSMRFRRPLVNGMQNGSMYYRAGTMFRRYLCEMRDNYVTPLRMRLSHPHPSSDL